jgi:membrane protease YdiL (CAAX protease family)
MLKRLYDKSNILFAVLFIVLYCALMSLGDGLSAMIGVEKLITLFVGLGLSAVLLWFLSKHGLLASYGLCLPKARAKEMLYYVPIFVMLSANLWYGFALNYSILETILYILSMLCVGFLEEVIFRGLLFEAIREGNVKAAVVVSSVTFGVGHIVNLFNGSGADLLFNLLQLVYATAAGFMFVMIYYRTKSIVGCIAAHGIFNALSVFSNEAAATQELRVLTCIALTVITGSYAAYLAWIVKGGKNS